MLWRSAWSRNSGIPIPQRLFHVTPTWQRTTCIFQWSFEREFMYFAGKLVYLIVHASNQFAVRIRSYFTQSSSIWILGDFKFLLWLSLWKSCHFKDYDKSIFLSTILMSYHAGKEYFSWTEKHLLFVWHYFREDTNWDIFTRLYFRDLEYFVL